MAPEVRIKREDVTAEEVVQHVKCGKRVAELGLVWRESIAFVLTDKLTMKNIRYLDVLTEEAQGGDTAAEQAYASQVIMANTLTTMLDELAGLLGGWQD